MKKVDEFFLLPLSKVPRGGGGGGGGGTSIAFTGMFIRGQISYTPKSGTTENACPKNGF